MRTAATFGCYAEIARLRSAPISSTLNTAAKGCQPSKRSQFDGRKFERSRKSSIPGVSFDRLQLALASCFSFSLLVPLRFLRIPFWLLTPRFPAPISHRRSSILDALEAPLLSLLLSQSAVDFLVHRPNFPGRYGQFNTRVFPPLRHARLVKDHFFSAYRGIRVRTDF